MADTRIKPPQLSQYVTEFQAPGHSIPPTEAVEAPVPPPAQAEVPIEAPQAQQEDEAAVTQPKISGSVARVEYRDQHGNVLPEELVASLRAEGKVKFETRFESRSRLEHAHEIPIVDGKPQFSAPAPPHPDVEGQNPETGRQPEDSVPPEGPASVAEGNMQSAESSYSPEAKPASEGYEEATQ